MKLLPGPLRRRNGATKEGAKVDIPPRERKEEVKREKESAKQRRREAMLEVPIATLGWLDERTGGGPFLRGFLYRKVPRGTNWYYTDRKSVV